MSKGNTAIWWEHKPFYLDGTVAANEIQKVVWEGDSIAAATFGCAYLDQRIPTIVNLAVPGSTTADLVTRQAAFIAAINDGGGNRAGCVWGGPYNSLAAAADTIAGGNAVADAWFAYLDNVLAGIAAANKLIIFNLLRRGNSPAGYPQTAWTQCALRILTDGPLHQRSTVGTAVEVADLPGTPGDDRYYEADLVHLNPPGYQWLHRQTVAPRLFAERF